MTKKELSAANEPQTCDVCGRTMLKGERPEAFLVRDGGRRLVCELCRRRAERAGWIRETAQPDLPAAQPSMERRPSLLARLRRRGPEPAHAEAEANPGGVPAEYSQSGEVAEPGGEPTAWREDYEDYAQARRRQAEHDGPRDPRHVRAVPTNADVKIAHALDIFNRCEHAHTIAGLCRTLGAPWVAALPLLEAPSEVAVVVAWELSWYQYRIDLGDTSEPAMLIAKGHELDELDDSLKQWNASALADGTLAVGVAPAQ
jgi:hypothetical protein